VKKREKELQKGSRFLPRKEQERFIEVRAGA